jgi:hypothetical protein
MSSRHSTRGSDCLGQKQGHATLIARVRHLNDKKKSIIRGLPDRIAEENPEVAKNRKRRYSRSAGRDVESEMRRYKRGSAKSGRGGKGGKVKSRKQAIAIGLSKARKKGKKVPKKKS